MVLKMTSEQFKALHVVFGKIIYATPQNIPESLAMELMIPIYKKLDARVNSYMNGKRGWNLTLTPLQAKAYYTFFFEMTFDECWRYEGIIIKKHLNEINRVFA